MMRTVAGVLLMAAVGMAQQQQELARHEAGLTLGRLRASERGAGVTSGGGTALQANYGLRVAGNATVSVFAEVHLLASPQRLVTGPAAATRDYASLYITPGVRVKFRGNARVQPYVAVGGGYANYEHSTTTLAGAANPAPRHSSHGVLGFGGGVDVPVWRWIGVRVEARDFYSASPVYNVSPGGGRQHNVVAGGGLVLRFGGGE